MEEFEDPTATVINVKQNNLMGSFLGVGLSAWYHKRRFKKETLNQFERQYANFSFFFQVFSQESAPRVTRRFNRTTTWNNNGLTWLLQTGQPRLDLVTHLAMVIAWSCKRLRLSLSILTSRQSSKPATKYIHKNKIFLLLAKIATCIGPLLNYPFYHCKVLSLNVFSGSFTFAMFAIVLGFSSPNYLRF